MTPTDVRVRLAELNPIEREAMVKAARRGKRIFKKGKKNDRPF